MKALLLKTHQCRVPKRSIPLEADQQSDMYMYTASRDGQFVVAPANCIKPGRTETETASRHRRKTNTSTFHSLEITAFNRKLMK